MVVRNGRTKSGPRPAGENATVWDTNSPLDYPEEWTSESDHLPQRSLDHILAVRLDAKTIEHLAAIGRKKGIGPSTLARMWLLECLDGQAQPD